MKPKPFCELKNLTVPLAISRPLMKQMSLCRAHDHRTPWYPTSGLSWRGAPGGHTSSKAKISNGADIGPWTRLFNHHGGERPGRMAGVVRSCEHETDAPVELALLLDLRHAHRADLGRAPHVGSTAWLQVEPDDLHQPHPAGARGGLHRHGLD